MHKKMSEKIDLYLSKYYTTYILHEKVTKLYSI